MPPRTNVRKVFFYRVAAGIDDTGRPRDFDPVPALEMVDALGFEDGARYLDVGDGDVSCCWVDSRRYPQKARLARVRRRYLPQIERQGNLADLDLEPGSGLAEQTHLVFFRYNIIGTLFNWYGPRVSHLRHYLADRCDQSFMYLDFEALVRNDAAERLNRIGGVKALTLSVSRQHLDRVDKVPGLYDALAAMPIFDADQITLELKPRRYSRDLISRNILGWVTNLMDRGDAHEWATIFKVQGVDRATGRLDTIDLLGDQFAVEKEIEWDPDHEGHIRDRSAYKAIIDAYGELGDALLYAAGVRVDE